jgi:hypothetical protein
MKKSELPPQFEGDPWRRMPKPKERLYGLSRTTLFELGEANFIRIIRLRKPGAIRGVALIYMPSLHAYLHSLNAGHTEA